MCFFNVKHCFGHISGMVGPIDMKWKGSALDGYWVQYETSTFDLTHDFEPGCFKVKCRNSSISGIFKVKHYSGHIWRMVGPIDVKRKGSALVGYWVQYVTFDLTHDLDLGCFKVKFRNCSISGIVGLIDVKLKGSELIWYWADGMTLPFHHTHDLDLRVSRRESEIALFQ